MRLWYLHALTPEQIASFYSYRMSCKENRKLWQVELQRDLESGKSKYVSSSEIADLISARRLLGERIISEVPIFEEGDGVNYKGNPGTIVKKEKSKIYVRLDKWHSVKAGHGHRILFEPVIEDPDETKGIHVFTRRKDYQFRLSGYRSPDTLGLGRYVGKW